MAVDLNEEVRRKIAPLIEKASRISGVKAVEVENLHITLQFLGEVKDSKIPAIEDELSKVKFEQFKVSFQGVGAFPTPSSPRVVWVGISDGGKLKQLADSVHHQLKKLGFRRDKEFSAHVTIARVKRKNPEIKTLIGEHSSEFFGEMEVKNFRLKQSVLRPQGPIYKDLMVFGYED